MYVLINEGMPDLVKIGRTNDLDVRIRELSRTNVPFPFECHHAVEVEDTAAAIDLERKLHKLFASDRVPTGREFFRTPPEKVVVAMSIGDCKVVSRSLADLEQPDSNIEHSDVVAVAQEKKRRDKLKLDRIGVPIGSTLHFTRDESITCTTLNNNRVMYDGKETSLSAAALDVLQTNYQITGNAVQGSIYWMYEGKTLDERRRLIEKAA